MLEAGSQKAQARREIAQTKSYLFNVDMLARIKIIISDYHAQVKGIAIRKSNICIIVSIKRRAEGEQMPRRT